MLPVFLSFIAMLQCTANPADLTWVIVVVGEIACAYMACGIEANDVANAFGSAFGAKSLTVKQACIVAAVCKAIGAIILGDHVSDTIRKGMSEGKYYSIEVVVVSTNTKRRRQL